MTWTEKMPGERIVLKMLEDIQMAMEEPIISSTIDISSASKQPLFEVKGEFHSMNKSEVDEFVSELFDLSLHGYSIKSVKVCLYSDYHLMMRVHVKKYEESKSNITGKVMGKLLKIMTSDLDSDEEL